MENGQLGSSFISAHRKRPELFIAGGSSAARDLAISHGDCWMRLPDLPAAVAAAARPVLETGKSVGLRFSVIGAATRAEALEMAYALRDGVDRVVPERQLEGRFVAHSDSASIRAMYQAAEATEWLTPTSNGKQW